MENDGQPPPSATQPQEQPVGTTVMNTEVLKEPRGFMRILQCFFAMVAFATCANYTATNGYKVQCTSGKTVSQNNTFYYPFRLDHDAKPLTIDCNADGSKQFKTDGIVRQPGDFKSDAEFFVFTGVVAFLGSMASIVVYVFFSGLYSDDQKKFPLYDFCFTVVIAVFWLSASAAWANGVSNLKFVVDPDNWLVQPTGMRFCQDATKADYGVQSCEALDRGRFGGANGSVLLGFLNFFLWASNLWFVYKETHWFAGRSNQSQQMTNQP